MKLWTLRLLRPFGQRRLLSVSLVCFLALVAFWFQFGSEDSEAETLAEQLSTSTTSVSPPLSAVEQADCEESASGSAIALASATAADSHDPDARQRALVAGNWEDEYRGKRSLYVAADGTGKMVIDLDGVGKRLFAPRMSFDMNWSLADGYVTMTTLGGKPESKVKLVLKMYGNEARYKILELTAERMLLLDADGKTTYDWRRPGSGTTPAHEALGADAQP
jgi:hypothetical protein